MEQGIRTIGPFRFDPARASRLNPLDPFADVWLCGAAHGHLVRGQHFEALTWAAQSYARNTKFDPVLWIMIAANAHLERMTEAGNYRAELLLLNPAATIAGIRRGQCAKDPSRPMRQGSVAANAPRIRRGSSRCLPGSGGQVCRIRIG